jgi:hypothetical protein
MDLTLRNDMLGTAGTVRVGDDGKVSSRARARMQAKLLPPWKAPPGSLARQQAGPLGEHGEQVPPQTMGRWRYEIRPTEDGGAELVPHEVKAAKRGRKASR